MAKEDKKEKVVKEEFKYSIQDVADGLDIEPASARVRLRNAGIEKAGKSYGWNSKAEVEEIVKKLKKPDEKKAPKDAVKKSAPKSAEKKTKEAA